MAQKHNVEYTEKPMTRDGRIQAPSRRYRRLRHPTFPAALWTEKNPLLQRGEIGIEIDTHMAKLGDGHTYWNDLPYALKKDYAWGEIVGDIENQTDLVDFVDNAVAAETDRATAAENVLQQHIDDEAATRENADNALSARITTNAADIAQEISDREDADVTLQNNIDTEEAARISADNALSGRIDTTNSNLSAEISARESADSALQGQITTNKTTMDNHIADTANPHQVTKAQVGLGNVDNTSDLAKPISTATQAALDSKADKTMTYTKVETDTLLATKQDIIADLGTIRTGAAIYTHDQAVAEKVWTITHNLGKHPSIDVVDTSGNIVTGKYTYVDENTVVVEFNAPFKGMAFLN